MQVVPGSKAGQVSVVNLDPSFLFISVLISFQLNSPFLGPALRKGSSIIMKFSTKKRNAMGQVCTTPSEHH